MTKLFLILLLSFSLVYCMPDNQKVSDKNIENTDTIVEIGNTVQTRFIIPFGYERIPLPPNSFGTYLRNLPLKPVGSKVKYYDGKEKDKENVYSAVIDLPIGSKNLHQCADAIMRLKADYHYSKKEYDKIHFNLTNGFRMDFTKWMQGNRLKVSGNKTSWYKTKIVSNTEKEYWKYLEIIFTYAGTLSLSKELNSIDIAEMKIGDVFIQGGSPGHAVIVVDMIVNKKTDTKLFMLAQSYMPAQELQILVNPFQTELGVWYSLNKKTTIVTPEWNFRINDLKRF